MSTNKTTLHEGEELQHGDEAAALPPPPEAHPLAGAPTESLRQADEPPSEATQSPNPSQPGGPEGTAGVLTVENGLQGPDGPADWMTGVTKVM